MTELCNLWGVECCIGGDKENNRPKGRNRKITID